MYEQSIRTMTDAERFRLSSDLEQIETWADWRKPLALPAFALLLAVPLAAAAAILIQSAPPTELLEEARPEWPFILAMAAFACVLFGGAVVRRRWPAFLAARRDLPERRRWIEGALASGEIVADTVTADAVVVCQVPGQDESILLFCGRAGVYVYSGRHRLDWKEHWPARRFSVVWTRQHGVELSVDADGPYLPPRLRIDLRPGRNAHGSLTELLPDGFYAGKTQAEILQQLMVQTCRSCEYEIGPGFSETCPECGVAAV